MSNMDQEFWQDFVVEAEENIQELEPNLLLLEEDPSNASLINDCFRNMHSIKGAANYMGLKNIATLAHRMETLFGKVRDGELKIDENVMNVLLDGIDRVKLLVKEVAEAHKETSSIDDILASIEAILSGESVQADSPAVDDFSESAVVPEDFQLETDDDDAELMAIFVEEMARELEQLDELHEQAPVEREVVADIVRSMVRVINYIGRDELLEALEKRTGELLDGSGSSELMDAEELSELSVSLKKLFSGHLGMEFPETESGDREEEEQGLVMGETDQELYQIFLEFVQEEGRPLASIPDHPDSEWLEACRKAIERLSASANYMDYQDVVALFEEWNERLVEALSTVTEQKPFDGEPLRRLWARFCAMLPGLEQYASQWEKEHADGSSTVEPSGEGESQDGEWLDALQGMEDMFEGVIPETVEDAGEPDGAIEAEEEIKEEDGEEDQFEGLGSALDELFADVEQPETEPPSSSPPEEAEQQVEEKTAAAGEGSGAAVPPPFSPVPPTVPPAKSPGTEETASDSKLVRVDLAKVERLLEDVGELVVLRATMLQIADDMKELYNSWIDERKFSATELKPLKQIMIRTSEQTATLEKVVHQLQDGVMRMRMLPVGTLFNRYPRLVRDLSRKLGKKLELQVFGEGTALDKRVIEHITDPLQHIIRNAIDHGIEPPEVREKQGKSAAGTITLNAGQEGNFVVITISDDGRGLDREAIIQKAVANGIVSGETARTMSDERVWNMIFLPGISTASRVSDTSGRGVGMDVVKSNIERLGGQIYITSSPGRGTSITLRIPLTLAIIQALLVRVGEQNMAVPLSAVQETFRIYSDEISSIEGFEMISLRQETLPLIRLGQIFRGTGADPNPEKLFVVRVKMQDMEAGLAVDRFLGQQEVVIKPLAEYMTDEPGISGATILGDGTIALILDIPSVLDRARNFTLKRQQLMEQAVLGIGEKQTPPTLH